MDAERIKYLENLLPEDEAVLDKKYRGGFEKYATYLGNGMYQWNGCVSTCTRELWLMGVLHREKINYKNN